MFHDASSIDVSVVVPVYNSAATLAELIARLTKTMTSLDVAYELIFVDDGSRDDSWKELVRLQAADSAHVNAIQLMRNFGQCNAVMCGLRHARGRYIVTLDDDLQNPPEEIAKLLNQIERDRNDLVYGVYVETQQSLWRRFGSWLATKFHQRVFGVSADVTSFRIFRHEIVDAIQTYQLNFTYLDGLMAWNTQRIGQVTVEHHARKEGSSGYNFTKLFFVALNLLTNFSLLPLQFVSLCGIVAALGGLLTGAYYLIQHLTSTIDVPGYASIIVAVLVLGGMQLLSLGVLGEYVGRLHLNVNRKPQYTVRQVLASSSSAEMVSSDRLGVRG